MIESAAVTLSMGAITLHVRDLPTMRRFYTDIIGLEVLEEEQTDITLGFRERRIVILSAGNKPSAEFGEAGLYHLAIVFVTQGALANAVERVMAGTPELFAGSADHLVSEAFYMRDPEGNGVELYYDRDAAQWTWENGLVKMDSLYLSPEDYITKHATNAADPEVRLGHVHLRVGDITQAQTFYVDVLGFDLTSRMPSALFVSRDKYHHHIGMNTWESLGAAKRSDTLGLSGFEIVLHDAQELLLLKKRLQDAGVAYEEKDASLSFADPWENRLLVRV